MSVFTVSKLFTTGYLKGLVVEELTTVEMPVGTIIERSAISPSAYTVIKCEKVGA